MRHLIVALAAGCVLAIPATGHAQLGRIGGAIAKKAGVAPANPAETVQTGKVTFDAQVLEITDARVTSFLAGLAAEKQMVAKLDAQDTDGIQKRNDAARDANQKARDAWQKKDEAWDKCADAESAKTEQEVQKVAATGPDEATMTKIAERIKAAHARGDLAEVRRITDSVARVSMAVGNRAQSATNDGNAALIKKCGEKPVEPDAPAQEPMLTVQDVRLAGIKASGFNDAQYSILRERIVPFVLSKGKNSGGMIYTESEARVLAARLADLSPYAEQLKTY